MSISGRSAKALKQKCVWHVKGTTRRQGQLEWREEQAMGSEGVWTRVVITVTKGRSYRAESEDH